ncbi:hypothetical protein L1987_23099 [Smallanthus sonchifolius]|uniref:Uncharacterized protein n=1 Tax=Smallanthus sonchifolius TaxID=185202 RepID=A0ACB9II58_9ASTR|nr:hypothetical protein L1987_23099 [Smallanthus sonchifolius]
MSILFFLVSAGEYPLWMGQLSSTTAGVPSRRPQHVLDLIRISMADQNPPVFLSPSIGKKADHDISDLPDACLAYIFHFLGPADRKRCSLVCRCWLEVEGQSRNRLSLNAQSDLNSVAQSLFSRFDAVTKLSLRCDRRSSSIGDDALILISQRCQNLIRLKLRSCRQLTDSGIETLSKEL